ncbi:MAG: hypothetical protein WC780_11960 [Lentimicrobiaceae bacterium]
MAKVIETSATRITLRRLLRRPKYRYMAANRIVPHLPWLALFALAAFLYKARIFTDSGYYFLQFINKQSFWIEHQRIVLGLSQIIPIIGVWLGLQIKYVLLLYSLGNVLFFYVLFLFVYYGLRDRRSGLLIILAQTVGIIYSFFTPMFELYYGVSLLITFYAIWKLPFRYKTLYILLILEVFILLSHPLAFMLFVYLLLYDFRKETAKPFKFYLPVILVFLGALAFKYLNLSEYESAKLGWQFNYTQNRQYLQFLNPAFYETIGIFMLRYYFEILAAFIIVIFMLVNRKQWFRLFLVSGTFLAYTFLVNTANTLEPSRYLEQVMFPYVPIVFIPLIYGYDSKGRQGRHNVAVLLISALIVYRLAVIYWGSEIFVKRIAQMEQLIETARQKGGSKFVVSEDIADHGYTQFNWSYPIETLLLSAIDGNDISVTIVPEEDYYFNNNNNKISARQFIFRKWELKDENWLNKRYFHLDIGPYHLINDTTPNNNISLTANNLRINIDAKNIYRAMDTVWIPVTITNKGSIPVYSGKNNKVFLSYFWVENNNVLNWDEIRTPLQADILGRMSQDIKVAVPENKGPMQLKVDIIAENDWLGLYSQEDVLVY